MTPIAIIQETALAVASGVVIWFVCFPFRTAYNSATETLTTLKNELSTQRTNCLTTIQADGKTQINLLSKMSDTLDGIHTGQTELSGYIKGVVAAGNHRV